MPMMSDWADPELEKAYELLDNVVGRLSDTDLYNQARTVQSAIEQLDVAIEGQS